MTDKRIYLSTTIPYVNGRPHIGHALEFVQADVLARHHRQLGDQVRFQTGTDDNSLKNVLAAQAAGISTRRLVDRNADAFAALQNQLDLSPDDFIRTSSDPRHRPCVERLWRACAARGDFYRHPYEGRYCTGCEQFYVAAELAEGRCPEHGSTPQVVRETNWFFRLARYAGQLDDLVRSGELRIHPAGHRKAVLRFIEAGLDDFSVSRSAIRSRGWGVPVPGDPDQVIYVWWDALANYISTLRYGSGAGRDGADYRFWWADADRRIHLAGKGVVRFHAVYWPAILLSAGLPLPTDIYVHDYLTVGGHRISKSALAARAAPPAARAESASSAGQVSAASADGGGGPGGDADPAVLASRYGSDAVRWWLLRDVPQAGDADFTPQRLVGRANTELAGAIGNLISRVGALVRSYRGGEVPGPPLPGWQPGADLPPGVPQPAAAADLLTACAIASSRIGAALADYDFRAATSHVLAIADAANRYAERAEPWHLARAELAGDTAASAKLDAVLWLLVAACHALGATLEPFLPALAGRIRAASSAAAEPCPRPVAVFPRIS